MEINRRFVHLYGKIETGKELELGQDINPTVTVTHVVDKDNNDGTIDRIYKARVFSE